MRLLRLDLGRWGALADVSLDLSAARLHLVFGANEAGKSTTRRGIASLLFGIPARSTDGFRYEYRSLRLGGVLGFSDGTSVEIRRRKGNKDTLLGPDDRPISDARLAKAIGGIDRETFEREWSLDHEGLRRGGEALLAGAGDLGQSLLGAGLGGVGVGDLQARLDAEAALLWNRSKRGGRLVELAAAVREQRRAREEHTVRAPEYDEKESRLTQLRAQRDEGEAELRRLGQEHERLQRVARARGPLAERDQVASALDKLAGVPRLVENFGARRAELERELDRARLSLEAARGEAAQHDEQVQSIVVDAQTLASSGAIDGLVSDRRAHRARLAQVRVLEETLRSSERELEALATSVGLSSPSLIELSSGPYRARAARARELADAAVDLRVRIASGTEALRAAEAEVSRLTSLVESRQAGDESAFAAAYERADREVGGSGKLLAALRQRHEQAARAAREARADVGAADVALAARLPAVAEVDDCEERLAVSARVAELRVAERDEEDAVARCEGEVARLTVRDAPTEATLSSARAARSESWKRLRDHVSLPVDHADPRGLLLAHEVAVDYADTVADRLRADAERAIRCGAAVLAHDEALRRLARVQAERAQAEVDEARANDAWRALFVPLGVTPGSPTAMREWLRCVESARGLARAAAAAEEEFRAEQARVSREIAPLAAALGLEDSSDVDEVLRAGATRARRLTEARRASVEAARAREQARARVAELNRSLAELETGRRAWTGQWTDLITSCRLATVEPADVIAVFDAAIVAAGLQHRAGDAEHALAAALGESDRYLRDARRLAALLGGPSDASVDDTVQWLDERLRIVRDAAQRRSAESSRAEDARRRITEASLAVALTEASLSRHCADAGSAVPQVLARIEADNDERRSLEARLATTERELAMVTTDGLEGLRADVLSSSVHDIDARIAEIAAARRVLMDRATLVNQQLGALAHDLGGVTGSAQAAEAEAAAQSLVASVGDGAAEYLRLAFASYLLRRAVETFRLENQSPILVRASALFARLTGGSFSAVVVDEVDESARAVIKAQRPAGGELVAVDGMSDGVRDQLFLALRLAAIERQLERRDPLPIVADDLLVNLSDDRAAVTLGVLAELAARTQVILFTHHSRIVELARHLPSAPVVHVLPDSRVREIPHG